MGLPWAKLYFWLQKPNDNIILTLFPMSEVSFRKQDLLKLPEPIIFSDWQQF